MIRAGPSMHQDDHDARYRMARENMAAELHAGPSGL
jgi:hypothetical protein